MMISQKCQYALRALLELARHGDGKPVAANEVAANQQLPQRFLEIILNELKPTGLVASRRGARGGFVLGREPKQITVGEVIRHVDGPLDPVRCVGEGDPEGCRMFPRCALLELWTRAKEAVDEVYDGATLADILAREEQLKQGGALDYSI